MWEKITAFFGLILAFIMAVLLGKSHAQKIQAKKEAKEANEQIKKEAEYKAEAHKVKEEIFQEAEVEKQKLNKGDNSDRFNAALDMLRKH